LPGFALTEDIAAGKTEVDTLNGDKIAVEKAADGSVTVGGAMPPTSGRCQLS
jgi:hypothetical protein